MSESKSESRSEKYTLDSIDLRKVGTGLLIALGGAALTYLTDLIPSIDWGSFTPVVVSAWSVVVNIARKYLTNHS